MLPRRGFDFGQKPTLRGLLALACWSTSYTGSGVGSRMPQGTGLRKGAGDRVRDRPPASLMRRLAMAHDAALMRPVAPAWCVECCKEKCWERVWARSYGIARRHRDCGGLRRRMTLRLSALRRVTHGPGHLRSPPFIVSPPSRSHSAGYSPAATQRRKTNIPDPVAVRPARALTGLKWMVAIWAA